MFIVGVVWGCVGLEVEMKVCGWAFLVFMFCKGGVCGCRSVSVLIG